MPIFYGGFRLYIGSFSWVKFVSLFYFIHYYILLVFVRRDIIKDRTFVWSLSLGPHYRLGAALVKVATEDLIFSCAIAASAAESREKYPLQLSQPSYSIIFRTKCTLTQIISFLNLIINKLRQKYQNSLSKLINLRFNFLSRPMVQPRNPQWNGVQCNSRTGTSGYI